MLLLLVAALAAADAFVLRPLLPSSAALRLPSSAAPSSPPRALATSSTKSRRHGALSMELRAARGRRAPEREWRSRSSSKTTKAIVLATVRSLYFPLTVLGAGILGAWTPAAYAGLSDGFVTRALAGVMVLMGATLSVDDFKRIGRSRRAVLLGWAAQFTIMPSMALLMSRLYKLPPHLAAGVVLVGCCPGGTASNLVTLLAEADVALSVTM